MSVDFPAENVILIGSGICAYKHGSDEEDFNAVLQQGDFLAEHTIWIVGWTYCGDLNTETNSELVSIPCRVLRSAFCEDPASIGFVQNYAKAFHERTCEDAMQTGWFTDVSLDRTDLKDLIRKAAEQDMKKFDVNSEGKRLSEVQQADPEMRQTISQTGRSFNFRQALKSIAAAPHDRVTTRGSVLG